MSANLVLNDGTIACCSGTKTDAEKFKNAKNALTREQSYATIFCGYYRMNLGRKAGKKQSFRDSIHIQSSRESNVDEV